MPDVHLDPRQRRGDYGIDGDFDVVPARWQFVIVTAVCLALAAGNGPDATRRNAEREGVAGRVELHTGDMSRLPFADNTFDLVISRPRGQHRLVAMRDVSPSEELTTRYALFPDQRP